MSLRIISFTPGLRTIEDIGRLWRESVHLQLPWESAKYICTRCTASASYSFFAWRTSCFKILLFRATTLHTKSVRSEIGYKWMQDPLPYRQDFTTTAICFLAATYSKPMAAVINSVCSVRCRLEDNSGLHLSRWRVFVFFFFVAEGVVGRACTRQTWGRGSGGGLKLP